jgi:hypothetical protein
MNGVNQTAKLKFEHVGLGTTATRSGEDLIIQNDIGTTDAHVLVLRVNKLKATLTYTDIHIQRFCFFIRCLKNIMSNGMRLNTKNHTGSHSTLPKMLQFCKIPFLLFPQ